MHRSLLWNWQQNHRARARSRQWRSSFTSWMLQFYIENFWCSGIRLYFAEDFVQVHRKFWSKCCWAGTKINFQFFKMFNKKILRNSTILLIKLIKMQRKLKFSVSSTFLATLLNLYRCSMMKASRMISAMMELFKFFSTTATCRKWRWSKKNSTTLSKDSWNI